MDAAQERVDPPEAKSKAKNQQIIAVRERVLESYLNGTSSTPKYADPVATGKKRGKVAQEVEWRPHDGG